MEFFIDINSEITRNPLTFMWWFMTTIGWIFPVFLFLYGLVLGWLAFIRNKYRAARKYILLSIDVPRDNLQTARAVENIFSHLAGAHQDVKPLQKWWDGEIPDSFSFEIISMEGYIQFIIHTVDRYRDLIEAIIYAQYPDAEIAQVEDYTKRFKLKFPSKKYEMWGTEIKLSHDEFRPITTYIKFEHGTSEEYKDPMASLLEGFSRIGKGEYIWLQFVITPADNNWGDKSKSVINKMAGRKASSSSGGLNKVFGSIFEFIQLGISPATSTETKSSDDPPSLMLHLTPGERSTIEAIETKTSKIGFHVRTRAIYIAEKAKFKKSLGLNVVYGSLKQFNSTSNGFKPDGKTYTGGIRFFKQTRLNWRRQRILYKYKNRGHWLEPGYYGKILNTEELASVWHFPFSTAVHAPLVKKTDSKKSEPPLSLPLEQAIGNRGVRQVKTPAAQTPKAEPPTNLPI